VKDFLEKGLNERVDFLEEGLKNDRMSFLKKPLKKKEGPDFRFSFFKGLK